MRGLPLIFLALLNIAPCATAQRGMPVARFGSPRAGMSSRFFRNSVPFFTDSLFYNDLLNSGYPVASQPPLIIMQAMPPASPAPAQVSVPAEALLIELQGDRYVRLSGARSAGDQLIDRSSDSHDRLDSRDHPDLQVSLPPHASAQERGSAVLIFRDGHREEVSEYSIANGILYATGSYYADGSFNKKIELSALNLPETVDANRSRAVPFKLPTTPNEVVVGP